MPVIKCVASMSLAAIILPTLYAEPHCPGNVASLPFRFVNRHLIVLAVSVNHTGPYNFLLDSGAQMTLIDLSLAAVLHLDAQGAATVRGVGPGQSASYAQLDLVEAGSHAVAKQKVLVYNLQNLRFVDVQVQGILGEDFLEQFDVLIDNAHRLVCLDNSAAMRTEMERQHIPLVATAGSDEVGVMSGLLLITARLSGALRPVRLVLDSGANTAILFNTSQYMLLRPSHEVPVRGSGVDGSQPILFALPPQDVRIASLELHGVPFSSASIEKDSFVKGFDGVLSTWLFRRVFIDHTDHFAVLDPE